MPVSPDASMIVFRSGRHCGSNLISAPSLPVAVMLNRISIGSKLHAKHWDGQFYAAEVAAIAESKRRARAPIKVHFLGCA